MTDSEIVVRVADLRAGTGRDVLMTVGLGSCVAIVLYDPVVRVGGMAHVLLPTPALSRPDSNPAKFPQTAVPRLLELMGQDGGTARRITARLVGGASMFAGFASLGTIQMGERNIVSCRQVLYQHGLGLTGEATGGDFGRTVKLWVADGRVEVSSVAHGVQNL
ncbi:MAG: chemotaxis protein CheD [Gemmatimonadota bacterium]|nr:chemotaxis protein CheD [Gemmatimonadales bacterium]MDQ3138970.1 chemotaxis protein CheD [Gemmatimonadota bacterium]